ncbi:translation elongation factor-like protein [Candidatus Woesearchaeota archaeon]|nr:translation elongation factor-like protein [Candidatus Woesearchaeota archaeon]
MPEEERKPVGKITHFFPKISVAVIKADVLLKKGDKISIEGHDKKVEMTLESMQIEHKDVEEIKPGEEAGMKVPEDVKEGDLVYKAE